MKKFTESCSSSSQLVDENERVLVSVLQDDARLGQLDHERALAVKDVVGRTDPKTNVILV